VKELFFKNIFNLVSRYLTDTILVPDLHRFMLNQVLTIYDQVNLNGIDSLPITVQNDFINILKIGKDLDSFKSDINWDYYIDKIRIKSNVIPKNSSINFKMENLLKKGVLNKGAGQYLITLLETQKESEQFLSENIERIMRHIEIKRNKSLDKFDTELSIQEKWLEKHNMAIAFAIYSRRFKDYRVLNTTFKLNEWAYSHYQKKTDGVRLSRYLCALFEQEKSVEEILT
jgi:hypothetical protein